MQSSHIPPLTDFAQVGRVLELFKQYDCPIPTERLISRLTPLVSQATWAIFCLASHQNDIVLAKKALACMEDDKDYWSLCAGNSGMLKDAPKPSLGYLCSLFRIPDKPWVWSKKHGTWIPD
jgi:hypothetical protein